MNQTSPKTETNEKQVFYDFALACARVLENPDCPADLAAAIMELSDSLGEFIGPASPRGTTIALLRGLALINGRAESRHSLVCPEPNKTILDAQDAFLSASRSDSDKTQTFAKAAVN